MGFLGHLTHGSERSGLAGLWLGVVQAVPPARPPACLWDVAVLQPHPCTATASIGHPSLCPPLTQSRSLCSQLAFVLLVLFFAFQMILTVSAPGRAAICSQRHKDGLQWHRASPKPQRRQGGECRASTIPEPTCNLGMDAVGPGGSPWRDTPPGAPLCPALGAANISLQLQAPELGRVLRGDSDTYRHVTRATCVHLATRVAPRPQQCATEPMQGHGGG